MPGHEDANDPRTEGRATAGRGEEPGEEDGPGVGATVPPTLRVSVGTLARVVFDAPDGGQAMLALERTATVHASPEGATVAVVAKPFGGGARLIDPGALRAAIGGFRFDGERSRLEEDFRVLVRREAWRPIVELCRHHLPAGRGAVLDASPDRELAEEFHDALGVALAPDDYRLTPLGMRVRDAALPADSARAAGRPTARIYFVFEARVRNPAVVEALIRSSGAVSDPDLERTALQRADAGGRGRANGAIVLGLDAVREAYLALPKQRRGTPLTVVGHRLAGNVPVVLDGVEVPGFRSVGTAEP